MVENAMKAANDNEPTLFGRLPDDVDELDRMHAWLLVEMAEDDVDHVAYALDARLVRQVIDLKRPPARERPRLTIVG